MWGDSTEVNSLVTLMITRESGSCRASLIGGARATFPGGRYSTDRNGNYLPRKHLNPEPSRTLVYFCNYVDFGSREELFLSQR